MQSSVGHLGARAGCTAGQVRPEGLDVPGTDEDAWERASLCSLCFPYDL